MATTIPIGFKTKDSINLPFKSKVTARVVPQDVQG